MTWEEKDRAFQEERRREYLSINARIHGRHAAAQANGADERGRARDARYNATEKGRARRARYEASERGRATRVRYESSLHRAFASARNTCRRRECRCEELRQQLDAEYVAIAVAREEARP